MSGPNTSYRKGRDGWRGETVVPLGFQIEGKPAELTVTTYKRTSGGGLISYAGVQTRDGGFTTKRVFRDFHATLEYDANVRCTEKTVRVQHERLVAIIEDYIVLAKVHHHQLGDMA